ncbi:hypothetical protein PPYR_10707 [Photinus pyralis]|uniref:Pinin/SDK/MemA protein domain-containing protein n=1 Tax=Photinus pyralis TaxID=7054 RepID=A0A5N4AH85_PHOPY|nr:pinin-like [Photinus pyralis]XP_031347746.1 pinin-like [Photinus pyralis]XP_031347748.1 pinin-like [Photinus pyralis]KAB0796646.1 hypothetical protein PPYR_10707 [Photinus pyralis]
MGTARLKSFGDLQSQLERSKSSLKVIDENIKRLMGRCPFETIPRPGIKRNLPIEENTSNFDHDEPLNKRRRLSEKPSPYEVKILQQPQKQLIIKLIVTRCVDRGRQLALAAQSADDKSTARNRRMFRVLLGTLKKFQQEEAKLKSKEQKRARIEKRIEERELREKARIKKERRDLFFIREGKQAEIEVMELQMARMRDYEVWEERQKLRKNFILTKAKPRICYLPGRVNDATKGLLKKSKFHVNKIIEKRQSEVSREVRHISVE